MEEYEINLNTLALIPISEKKTKIFEKDSEFIVEKTVNKIMEESCEFFGSSLIGRQKGTSKLIGVTHKAPIIVEETKEIIFFPTSSPRLSNCCWISLNNLENYYSKNQNKTVVLEFKNKKELNLSISYGIVDNQILRATRLESVIRKRRKKNL